MSSLFDNHGRPVNYVRLAITDRCNLRCAYCMPEEGINFGPRSTLLQYEEMLRLLRILAGVGVEKVRITGGEPFVRRDVMDLFQGMAAIKGIKKIALTTNGTLTRAHLPALWALGVRQINLSLDTLDRDRFAQITRRDEFDAVWSTFRAMVEQKFEVKINVVLLQGRNDMDIIPFVKLTQHMPIGVRFIEEMPFNGGETSQGKLFWDWKRIESAIHAEFPRMRKIPDPPHSTALNYRIPGFAGSVGIIPAYSRTFCGTCNRLRITPQGLLKTCLYDQGVFNIRDLMRAGATDAEIKTALLDAIGNRAKDGFEAEQRRLGGFPARESMTTIGG